MPKEKVIRRIDDACFRVHEGPAVTVVNLEHGGQALPTACVFKT